MMIKIKPSRGDWGTEIRLRMLNQDLDILDLSTATAMKIYMDKPGGATIALDASLYTDGTDGKMKATIVGEHFDEDGVYRFEPVATFAGGEWGGVPILVDVAPSSRPVP